MSSSEESDSDSVSSGDSSRGSTASSVEDSKVSFVPNYLLETAQHVESHGSQIEKQLAEMLSTPKVTIEEDEISENDKLADQVAKLSRKLAEVQMKLHAERNEDQSNQENQSRNENNTQKQYAGMDPGQAFMLQRLNALEERFSTLTAQATEFNAAEANSLGADTDTFEIDSNDDLYNARHPIDPRQIEIQRAVDTIQRRQNEIRSSSHLNQ